MAFNVGNESDLSELLSERFGSEESAASILHSTIKYFLCWCSYCVQSYETCQDDGTYCRQQVRALRIGVRTFGLRGIGSEKDLVYLEDPCNFLRNSAAPPAPEPAEGRGAAYNNNFFLTLARGLVLYATESTHLFAWFYILYSRQAGISQTCCAVTLSCPSGQPGMPWSLKICSVYKRRDIFCLHPHSAAWPLTSFVYETQHAVAHAARPWPPYHTLHML